jgi:transcriptional regulator with XRE-family HTH domain
MPSASHSTLGERVRLLREQRGLTQSALAECLPEVKQQSIDQLEKNKVRRPRFLPELAAVFGVNLQWLQHGKGPKDAAQALPSFDVDRKLLSDVIMSLETVFRERNLAPTNEKKAELIAALYDAMSNLDKDADAKDSRPDKEKITQAAITLISYDTFLKRNRA